MKNREEAIGKLYNITYTNDKNIDSAIKHGDFSQDNDMNFYNDNCHGINN